MADKDIKATARPDRDRLDRGLYEAVRCTMTLDTRAKTLMQLFPQNGKRGRSAAGAAAAPQGAFRI